MEKLYQPDFSSIFGANYANAFTYGQIDSLIWPIFNEFEVSKVLKNLLELKNHDGRNYFYNRKISIEDEKVELYSSNISYGLVQAMDLNQSYGIANEDVVSVVKSDPEIFKGILSFNLENSAISELESLSNQIPVVGVVLYPSFCKIDIAEVNNKNLNELLNFCKKREYFVKIDIGNMNLPENYADYTTYDKFKSFLSRNPDIVIILSGLDFSGDFSLYYQLLKLYNNLWLEIDPRNIGGMTPTDYFKEIFTFKGFIQNSWHRIIIGSATPTLEISQMKRGFLEATEILKFPQRNLLRTWAFRNTNRLTPAIFKSNIEPNLFQAVRDIKKIKQIENDNDVTISFDVKLRSFAITQLLFITDLIKDIFKSCIEENPQFKDGEIFIRSYHTTVSLFINEHEFGNYLDMHYKFAEMSSKDSSQFLHTVRALENRPDFNFFDHDLANIYGNRQLILPVLDGKIKIGSRENFYVLVTFGPRTFNIHIKVKLTKDQ
ncbi:MAG: YjbQ family protein [Candidatus Lokiarchaeota archaeon]|nr:YjbQ family protein [Candidatus Lokiarchaeota archaeon]